MDLATWRSSYNTVHAVTQAWGIFNGILTIKIAWMTVFSTQKYCYIWELCFFNRTISESCKNVFDLCPFWKTMETLDSLWHLCEVLSQRMRKIREEVWIKLFPTWPLTADHWNQVKEDVCLQKFFSGILMNVQPSYWHQYKNHLHLFTYQRFSVYNQHSFMFRRCSVLLFLAADCWQRKCRRTQVGTRGCDASRDKRWWLMLYWVKMKTTLIWAILISDRLHVAQVAAERTCQAKKSIHN